MYDPSRQLGARSRATVRAPWARRVTTGADAGAASGLSIDDLGVPDPVDLASLGMDEPETEPPAPYVYGADSGSGARRLDEAYGAADSRHWSDVVDHLRGEGPSPEAFARETALDRVLQGIVLYQLRLSIAGERPGCRLGPQFDTGMASYPTRISDVPDDEVRLWREMAPLVAHPRAQARLYDLLSERGEEARGHAVAAGEAYLTTDDGLDPDDGGTTLRTVEYLVRAWELARRYQDWALHARAHTAMVTTAASELALPAHRPGVVLPLLEAVCAPALRKQPASAAPQPPGMPTLDDLIESAITRYPEDYTLAQTIDLARSRTKDPAGLAALNERHARLLLQQALTVDGFMRQHRLQVAIELAHKRGISDVVEEATRELQRIPREDLKLQTITSSVRMPRDAVQRYLDDFTRSPQWADGLTVFLASDCPTGSYQRIVQQERDLARVSVFRRLMRRTQLAREGLPAWSTSDDDQDALAERAWIAGVTAQEYGRLLARGMHDLAERYDLPDEETLTAHLSLNGRACTWGSLAASPGVCCCTGAGSTKPART